MSAFEPVARFFEDKQEHTLFKINELFDTLEQVSGLEGLVPDSVFTGDAEIFGVCNSYGKFLDVTPRWAMILRKYVYSFVTRTVGMVSYMEFFGSPYLGLQKITFTTADRNQWFSEIFDVDEEELKKDLHNCKAIKSTWAVVGDVFNMSIPYLLYRCFKSNLDATTKHQAMVDLLCMYHYKCLTSIVHNDYPFTARRDVVLETYNRLSLKYDIKKYKSWKALIEARANFILDPKTGIHYETFTKMDDDKKIVYMVGDIQDRLRGVVNDINKVFHDVAKKRTDIVKIDKARISLEDELSIKSVSKEVTQYVQYVERILTEETSFYKEELVNYAAGVLDGVPKDKLIFIIQRFPSIYNNPKKPEYKQYVDAVVMHLFEYTHSNNIQRTNVYDVLIKLRGAYGAPHSKNDTVKVIRSLGDDIVRDISGIKTPSTTTTLRTALSLYFVLRILSKDYYS
jgi:hypothetical protein